MQLIRDTFLEIKEIVFGEHNINIESYAEELTIRSGLSVDDIRIVYNYMMEMKSNYDKPKLTYSKKRLWEKCEDNLMLYYVELCIKAKEKVEVNGKVKSRSKNAILSDLVDIFIDRTKDSIPFRYYEITRAKRLKDKPKSESYLINNDSNSIEISHSSDTRSTEINKKDDDLLDMVVDFVDNVETVGVDVTALFKGLFAVSKKAVENSNVEKVEALEGKISFLDGELEVEKEKNESLQSEMAKLIADFEKLKQEIEYFNNLNGKQKLQQLNNFNRKMKYMIDKFGGVIAVGL